MQYFLKLSGRCFDHSTVIFGSGAGPRLVKDAIAALGHERLSVQTHSGHAFGRPIRVAAEQRVVFWRAQKSDDAKLLYKLIPQFLCASFVQSLFAQIPLDINIKERRYAANRHRRAVCFLHRAQIREISPLHRFLRVGGWMPDITIVEFGHGDEVFERAYLFRQLLPLADHFVGRPHIVDLPTFFLFDFEQPVDAIERHPPVIADDPAAAISVGQPGNDPGLSAAHDFRRIGVEHAVVVRLAIFSEGLMDVRIGFKAGGLKTRLDHAQTCAPPLTCLYEHQEPLASVRERRFGHNATSWENAGKPRKCSSRV
jgi:hypothetical protein